MKINIFNGGASIVDVTSMQSLHSALDVIKTTRTIILISECSFMKVGLAWILNKKAKEHDLSFGYCEPTLDDSIITFFKKNLGDKDVIFVCDDRKKHFSCFFDNVQELTVQQIKEKKYIDDFFLEQAFGFFSETNVHHDSCLTDIERQVIRLLMKGFNTRQISNLIGKNIKGISYYKRSAMRKVGVETTQELFQKFSDANKLKDNIAILSSNTVAMKRNSHTWATGME